MTNKKIEQIKKWHEYHGLCIDALLKSFITLDEFNLHEDEFDRFFDTLYPQEPQPETPDELLTDEEIRNNFRSNGEESYLRYCAELGIDLQDGINMARFGANKQLLKCHQRELRNKEEMK